MRKFYLKLAFCLVCGLLFMLILGGSLTSVAYMQDDRPTPTLTTTPLPELALPDWVNDPEASILSLETRDDIGSYGQHVLLNVGTGEIFPISLDYVDDVAWLETDEGIFLKLHRYQSSGRDNSDGFNEFVNIKTGELTRLPLGDTIAPQVQPITSIIQDNGAGASFQIMTEHKIVPNSTDIYHVHITLQVILDNPAEQIHKIIATRRNISDFSVKWVGGGQYLAVSYSYLAKYDPHIDLMEGLLVTRVNIYDTTGNFADEYSALGDLNSIQWSPNNPPRFLYRSPWDEMICLAEVEKYRQDCKLFSEWEIEQNRSITQYAWSADGTKVILTYRSDDNLHGGLCLFNIETTAIDCPLEKEVIDGTFGSYYQYQQPNQYGVFRYFSVVKDSYNERPSRQTGVCYLHQESYAVDCLVNDLIPAGSYYRATSLAPDGEILALIYQSYESQTYDESLCLLNLNTASITCPIAPDELYYIDEYSWSPDGNFLILMYNGPGPYGDDASYTEYGIVDISAGTFQAGGYVYLEHDFSDRWRPALPE